MSDASGTDSRTVMVTGGGGLLGRFVVDELLSVGEDVRVLDIKSPSQAVPFHECSIMAVDDVCDALAGCHSVIHLAGLDDGNYFPDKAFFETNVQGAWNVLHAAEQVGAKQVVVASSVASLGVGYERMPDYLSVDEKHPQRPTDSYGLSKQVIESVAVSYARRGTLRVVVLRPTLIVRPQCERAILHQLSLANPNVDDPDPTPSDEGVMPYGALSAMRTYIRSEDCARCFRQALDYDEQPFDVFNVAAVDSIGRVRTLEHYERVFGRTPEVRDASLYEADPYASSLDIRRTCAKLGWQPNGDWRDVSRNPGDGAP